MARDTPHHTAIHWFRRTVRLDDNRALGEAVARAAEVVPVFILDPAILDHPTTAPVRVKFLFDSLREVDAALRERGGRLIVRRGEPVEELERLVAETGATALFFSRDYEPYSRERDGAVTEAMRRRGVAVETFSDHLLTEPWEVQTRNGGPYTVFTPYRRVWAAHHFDAPAPPPARVPTPPALRSDPLPDVATDQKPAVVGGESEGLGRLAAFVADGVADYRERRDFPGVEGTSRLSAYLRMGVVSPRRVMQAVREKRARGAAEGAAEGANAFVSELAWRDFYYSILYNFPHVAGGAFKPGYDGVPWENDEALFAAWREGRTGYPIVDAAQRQMNGQAWMHNRARMITASFLTKDLLCDWRLGERYFMQKLVDGDQASNNGGWQWAAGTGTDAQPFFRIFNPVTQGEKFDPDGAYVKAWVPELRNVPPRYVHRPWELSPSEQEAVGCVLGRDYPRPIVDHAVQRAKALDLYRRATEAAGPGAAAPPGKEPGE